MNLKQLRAEAEDETPVKQKGWQQAVEAIYPLKINLLRIGDGELTYIDDDPQRPLKITQLNARASNIRNIHSKDRTYPSPVEATAVVFGSGKADLKGNADFLSRALRRRPRPVPSRRHPARILPSGRGALERDALRRNAVHRR